MARRVPIPSSWRRDDGAVSLFTALVVPAAALCILAAVDLNRAGGLRDSLQNAADAGAREIVRGLSEDQVDARLRAALRDGATGLADWESLAVEVSRAGDDTATVTLAVPFSGLLPLTSGIRVEAQAQARFFCTPPATRWVSASEACPDGQSGMASYESEEEGYCAAPTAAPAWRATGNRQNVVSTCTGS